MKQTKKSLYYRKAEKTNNPFTTPICEIGESMEEKIRRVTTTKEAIDNSAPMIYTERKDGVLPQYDIRTDRFEIAQNAMDKITATEIAKRQSQEETETEPKTTETE